MKHWPSNNTIVSVENQIQGCVGAHCLSDIDCFCRTKQELCLFRKRIPNRADKSEGYSEQIRREKQFCTS